MDLELDLSDLLNGAVPLHASVSRELEAEDLLVLGGATRSARVKAGKTNREGSAEQKPQLKRLRAIHHNAARLLAQGFKEVQVSAMIGLCQSRISILKNDPSFRSLMEFYKGQEETAFDNIRGRIHTLGEDALATLHERLIDEDELIETKTLLEIVTSMVDRVGHSPVKRTESKSTHLMLSPKDLEEMKREVKEVEGARVISRETAPAALPDNSAADSPRRIGNIFPLGREAEAAEPSAEEGDSLREEDGGSAPGSDEPGSVR